MGPSFWLGLGAQVSGYTNELLTVLCFVVAAVSIGYKIGRWSAKPERGRRLLPFVFIVAGIVGVLGSTAVTVAGFSLLSPKSDAAPAGPPPSAARQGPPINIGDISQWDSRLTGEPPNPRTEILRGPYEQEEIRDMRLALVSIEKILNGDLMEALNHVRLISQNWQQQYLKVGPEAYSAGLTSAKLMVIAASNQIGKVLSDHNAYRDEIGPPVQEFIQETETLSQAIGAVTNMTTTVASADETIRVNVINQDVHRLYGAMEKYERWRGAAAQDASTKLRRLRDYRP